MLVKLRIISGQVLFNQIGELVHFIIRFRLVQDSIYLAYISLDLVVHDKGLTALKNIHLSYGIVKDTLLLTAEELFNRLVILSHVKQIFFLGRNHSEEFIRIFHIADVSQKLLGF